MLGYLDLRAAVVLARFLVLARVAAFAFPPLDVLAVVLLVDFLAVRPVAAFVFLLVAA
jgi:hypothetical protein